jgi:hypothetical protein
LFQISPNPLLSLKKLATQRKGEKFFREASTQRTKHKENKVSKAVVRMQVTAKILSTL